MKQKLTRPEKLAVGSLLFGMYFGAGNLIFPVLMGQLAGEDVLLATIGFIVTAVGLPFLGILAMIISKSQSLFDLGSKVHPIFAYGFTIALYMTIGPMFALPRLGNVSFEIGLSSIVPTEHARLTLALFTTCFYALALFFALRPSRIITWIGRVINPLFLLCLGILFVAAFIQPMGDFRSTPVSPIYENRAFFKGFLEGYNTMDALAALAFGVIIIDAVKRLGITESRDVQRETAKSSVVSLVLMCLIYALLALVGAMSVNRLPVAENGGLALAAIARYYFGPYGYLLLVIIVTLACLKTAIGLIVACSETFTSLFPKSLSYTQYAILFTIFSCLVSNVGLSQLIQLSIPVLMFLYPMAIALILCALMSPWLEHRPMVYRTSILAVALVSIGDALNALQLPQLSPILDVYNRYLPFFDLGLGWLLPLFLGILIGLLWPRHHST